MARPRCVTMDTPEGERMFCSGLHDPLEYALVPGNHYVVVPVNHARSRKLGRECVFKKARRVRDDTYRGTYTYMAWVQFVDDERYGFVDPTSLMPPHLAPPPWGTGS